MCDSPGKPIFMKAWLAGELGERECFLINNHNSQKREKSGNKCQMHVFLRPRSHMQYQSTNSLLRPVILYYCLIGCCTSLALSIHEVMSDGKQVAAERKTRECSQNQLILQKQQSEIPFDVYPYLEVFVNDMSPEKYTQACQQSTNRYGQENNDYRCIVQS